MILASIGFVSIFLLGYLITQKFNLCDTFTETVAYSIVIGFANISIILTILGLVHLYLAVLVIVTEIIFLVYTVDIDFPPDKVNISVTKIELLALFLIIFSIASRFFIIQTFVPAAGGVDACKLYYPWAKQAYNNNRLPLYDSVAKDIPTGVSMSLVSMFWWFYFWNSGINHIFTYTIAPIASATTTIFIYLIVKHYYGQKFGLIGALLYTMNPTIAKWDILPYSEGLLLLFFTSFFYFSIKKQLTLQSLVVSATCLIKTSGIVLFALFGLYVLWHMYKQKKIPLTPIVLSLISVLWYYALYKVYGNPFPHLVMPMRIFEPHHVTDITLYVTSVAEGATIGSPLQWIRRFILHPERTLTTIDFLGFENFLALQIQPVTISRLVMLPVIFISVFSKHRHLHLSFFLFLMANSVIGVFDGRYITPMVISPIIASIFLFTNLQRFLPGHIYRKVGQQILGMSIYLLVSWFFDASWFEVYNHFYRNIAVFKILITILIPVVFISLLIRGTNKFQVSTRTLASLILTAIIIFSASYNNYDPLTKIEREAPMWNTYQAPLLRKFKDMNPDTYCLLLENPFAHTYSDVKMIEVADPTHIWMIDPLFDTRDATSMTTIFFGSDYRRIKTQGKVVGDFRNNGFGAEVQYATISVNLTKDEYYIIIEHYPDKFSYGSQSDITIEYNGTYTSPLHDNDILSMRNQYDGIININVRNVYLKHILIVPAKYITEERMDSHYSTLKDLGVEYIFYGRTPSHVWFYQLSSLYNGLLLGISDDFEIAYESDYWILYKLKGFDKSE